MACALPRWWPKTGRSPPRHPVSTGARVRLWKAAAAAGTPFGEHDSFIPQARVPTIWAVSQSWPWGIPWPIGSITDAPTPFPIPPAYRTRGRKTHKRPEKCGLLPTPSAPGTIPGDSPGACPDPQNSTSGFFLVPGPRPRPRRVSYAKQPLNAAAIAGSKGCRPPADFAERRGAKCTMARLGSRCAKHWRGSRPVRASGWPDKESSDRVLRGVHRKADHTGLEDRRGTHLARLPRFRSGAGGPLVQTWFKGNAGESPASGLHRLCGSAVCSNGGLSAAGDHMGLAIHSRAAPVDVFSGLLWFRAPAERCLPAT